MKRLLALVVSLILIISSVNVVFADNIIDANGIISFASGYGTDKYDATINQKINKFILQNEDYIFMVIGAPVPARGKIHIYKKPEEGETGYKYLTSIGLKSTNSKWDMPIRNVWISGDNLYVTWNNAKTSGLYTTGLRQSNGTADPLYSYDISQIEEGDELSPTLISNGSIYHAAFHPYNRGGTSFIDEEQSLLYQTVYSGKQTDGVMTSLNMNYRVYDISSGTPSLNKTLSGGSVDAVHIYVKDGFLYEVLQNNNGLDVSGGTSSQEFNKVNIYNISENTEDADLGDLLVASYTTDIAGNHVLNDIEVIGDFLYLATTKEVEVINISEVKNTSSDAPLILSKENSLEEGRKINVLKYFDEKLYVGTDKGMAIYDVSSQTAKSHETYTCSGGFADIDINEDENMIYALSGTENGGMIIINGDSLFKSLNVSDIEILKGTEKKDVLSEGEYALRADITNPHPNDIKFKAVILLYENGVLSSVSIKEETIAADGNFVLEDSVAVGKAENAFVRMILLTEDGAVIPMCSENGTRLKQEAYTIQSETISANETAEFGELDIDGKIAVSEKLADHIGRPIYVSVINSDAQADDRMAAIRYIDVITTDKDGNYAFDMYPTDSGEYTLEIYNPLGKGSVSSSITIPKPEIKVEDIIEIPGVDAFVCIKLNKGKNIDKLELEVLFDEGITVLDSVETSEYFEKSDAVIENGKLNIKFTKKTAINAGEYELCIIPIRISDNADLGDHNISINVSAFDKYLTQLKVTSADGVLTLVESTPKYDAIEDAIDALKLLKKAEEIGVDDYLEEVSKIENARDKVDYAYTFLARDSQLGIELLDNLKKAESKMAELKPYYDAVDNVNAAEKEQVITVIKANNQYFNIEENVLKIYDDLEDKSDIDEKMSDAIFVKPSDVYKKFYELVVLNGVSEMRWQEVEALLTYAKAAGVLETSGFDKLTDDEQSQVQKALALRKYDDISELQNALDKAVADAKETPSVQPSRPTSGGGGGSGKVKETVYISQDTPKQETQETKEVFNDIENFGWAKDAISYLHENGIINGKASGVFAPSDNVTRAEFAKMISVAFDIENANADINFKDVAENAWYSQYVYALASNGIVNGRPDGTFGANENITREEIAVVFERVARFKGLNLNENGAADFTDNDEISTYALSAINKMHSNGLISGYPDGSVKPKNFANRAEAAQLIYKMMKLSK